MSQIRRFLDSASSSSRGVVVAPLADLAGLAGRDLGTDLASVVIRPVGSSGVYNWQLGDSGVVGFLEGLSPVEDRLIFLPSLNRLQPGDSLPDYWLQTGGGVNIPCLLSAVPSLVGSVSPGTAVLDVFTGILSLGSGLLSSDTFYGSGESLGVFVSGLGSRIWPGSFEPWSDLFLSYFCSSSYLSCRGYLRDADLPNSGDLVQGNFCFSRESGKLVFAFADLGKLFISSGFGVLNNPVPAPVLISIDLVTGRGLVPLGTNVNWPLGLSGIPENFVHGFSGGENFLRGFSGELVLVKYDLDLPSGLTLGRDQAYLSLQSRILQIRAHGLSQVELVWGSVPIGVSSPAGSCSLVGLTRGPFEFAIASEFACDRDGDLFGAMIPAGRYTCPALLDLLVSLGFSGFSSLNNVICFTGVSDIRIITGGFGLLTGWSSRVLLPVEFGGVSWNSYYGLILGLYREAGAVDLNIRSYGTLDNALLVSLVGLSSTVYLGVAFPSIDRPGWDDLGLDGGFFKITGTNGLESQGLIGLGGLDDVSSWGVGVFLDCESRSGLQFIERVLLGPSLVRAATSSLFLDGVIVDPGCLILRVQDADALGWQDLVSGTDYLLQGSQLDLITVIAPELFTGLSGSCLDGFFTDPRVTSWAASLVGCFLVQGSQVYLVTGVSGLPSPGLSLSPEVTFGSGAWQILESFDSALYDPGVVCDFQYVSLPTYADLAGLASSPWIVNLITPVSGVVVSPSSSSDLGLRYGDYESGSQSSSLVALQTSLLVAAQMPVSGRGLLPVVCLSDPHYGLSLEGVGQPAYFRLRVARDLSLPMVLVSSFDPVTPAGLVQIGCFGSLVMGEFRVSSDLVSLYEGLSIYYDQELLPPSELDLLGFAEFDPSTGVLSTPTEFTSVTPKFLVEPVSPVLNPIAGSMFFEHPVNAGQLVESSYYPTNSGGLIKTGDLLTEILPHVIRLERAERISPREYSFNPTGLIYAGESSSNGPPMIWVGADQQNYSSGDAPTVLVTSDQTLMFTFDVPVGVTVQITYSVLNCPENACVQAFTIATPPVWMPPFWLSAGQSQFDLSGDRLELIQVGRLVLIGGRFASYVTGVSFLADESITQITISPAPVSEVGSRSPGRDSGLLVTSGVFPDGFMLALPSGIFLGAKVGASQVLFSGSLAFAGAGHVLELAGEPLIITSVGLESSGRFTQVLLACPITHDFGPESLVRLSARPVFDSLPSRFALGPLVSLASLIKFSADPSLPGLVLQPDSDFVVDSAGLVQFQAPVLMGLSPGDRLFASFTRSRVLTPVTVDGGVLYPSYKIEYLRVATPSASNYLLGATLRGKYSYYDPEVFSISAQSMASYLPTVQLDAASRPGNPNATATPLAFPQGGLAQGTQGLPGENPRNNAWDALNLDAGGREFVTLFNNAITPLEQVLEAIDGRVIGDRDGKFRFFVGPESASPIPGGVYDLTSHVLYPRVLWQDIMKSWSSTLGWDFEITDPIYDPRTIYQGDPVGYPGRPYGLLPGSDTLDRFMGLQKAYQRNDIDDVLLVGIGRPVGKLVSTFFKVELPGVFQSAWEPGANSRLYPESAKHFSRLLPGLGAIMSPENGSVLDPGFYSAGRLTTVPGNLPGQTRAEIAKTRNSMIGQVSNPVIGGITNLSDLTANPRGPRFRVWAYYPVGSAALDLELGVITVGRATLILTPQFLNDFVINPSSGFPNWESLITNGGSNPDVNSGDYELSTPGLSPGQQIALGKPDRSLCVLAEPSSFLGFLGGAILIHTVQAGCVVTLKNLADDILSGSDIRMSDPDSGGFVEFSPVQGDTIYVPVSQTTINPASVSDPVNLADAAKLANTNGDFRIQTDLKIRRKSGQLIDASLPVSEDIWGLPLQDWMGQKPPAPGSCIEGSVEFTNMSPDPMLLPALFGQSRDDSGDCQIPFLSSENTEISLLRKAAALFDGIVALESSDLISPVGAVYPDEIAVSDGVIYGVVTDNLEPGVLITTQDFTPVYSPGSGIGSTRPYDLLFVQTGQEPIGITGVQTVGSVSSHEISPPRFVTRTRRGDLHRYTARNLFGHKGLGVTGLQVTELASVISFDFSSVLGLILDDGRNTGSGGLDALVNLGVTPGNALTIDVYDPSAQAAIGQAYLGSITVTNTTLLAGLYYLNPVSGITGTNFMPPGWDLVNSSLLRIKAFASFLDALGLVSGTHYDFTITLDTYIDNVTSLKTGGAIATGSGAGSSTSSINADRLTFDDRVSFASALPRATHPANGQNLEMGLALAVWESPVGSPAEVSTVNSIGPVNGGAYLTFVARSYGVGDFTIATGPGLGDEIGSVMAMPWEGHDNTPITGSGLVVSAAPSWETSQDGVICSGIGLVLDSDPVGVYSNEARTWVQNIAIASGGLANVQPGDILEISSGEILDSGAVKSGTYLVRHTVVASSPGTREISVGISAGDKGCFDLRFPRVKSFNPLGGLTLANVQPALYSPTGCVFAATGFVYVLRKPVWVTHNGLDYVIDPDSIYRAEYSAVVYDPETQQAEFTLNFFFWRADSATIDLATFAAGVQPDMRVSGFSYLPFGQLAPDLPDNNLLGPGMLAVAGVANLTIGNRSISGAGAGASRTWTIGSGLVQDLALPDQIAVRLPTPANSQAFYADRATIVYGRQAQAFGPDSGVASHLDLTQVFWDYTHFNPVPGLPTLLQCLLPGDEIALSSNLALATAGFIATPGIFLEPSFPLPVGNLTGLAAHVVTANSTTTQVGMRKHGDFVSGGTQEAVTFTVRRIRRFHEAQTSLATVINALRPLYELRRGLITGLINTPVITVSLPNGLADLGPFTNPVAGIKPGCVLRILDQSGALLDTAEISNVSGPYELTLRNNGLTANLASADSFEIYLFDAPVPHEQSCDQLLTELTNPNGGGSVLYTRTVDYTVYPFGSGGRVDIANELLDSGLAALELLEGDYVVIDPAGALYASGEHGSRPSGDRAVLDRANFLAGTPTQTDDNRGFYRVTEDKPIGVAILKVSGASKFSGAALDGDDDVIYGDGDAAYAVLPTVTGSGGPDREGQQTLRVTAASVNGAFLDRVGPSSQKSIEPFGFQVIRPARRVFASNNAIATVLFMRERMLSWIELLQTAYDRGGDYWAFQRDDQISDLPSPTDSSRGAGIFSNLVITGLQGLVAETPFANDSDCLSVLDRRLWIGDSALDYQPAGLGHYAALTSNAWDQRPILVDALDDILNQEDDLRGSRYAWVDYRANRTTGSIVRARQALERLRQVQKAQRLAIKRSR